MEPDLQPEPAQCTHRYLTSYGDGWECANRKCRVGILSLAVPLPMPLVKEALEAIGVITIIVRTWQTL
jgi:hypothetical protein